MLGDMGATQPLLLHPGCPRPDDPGITAVLDLCAAVLQADWVQLVLSQEGEGDSMTYAHGTAEGGGNSRDLEVNDAFSAMILFGGDSDPSTDILRSLSAALAIALDRHQLRQQTAVLQAALDSTSSSVLLFDRRGDILYANPPADGLLSLQTEDDLLVETEGNAPLPLFSVLSSLVERVASSGGEKPAWQGTMQSLDGRVLACEVTPLPSMRSLPDTVLVLLQYLGSEPAVRIDSFCLTHNLSPREKEVVKLLVEGLTTLAMAERLGISPHTVRDHLKNLYRKTGTSSRSELLGLASRTAPATTGMPA